MRTNSGTTSPKKRDGHRSVTKAQCYLAGFICEMEVADFDDVIRAMEAGERNKVEEWKAEAERRKAAGFGRIEWFLPGYHARIPNHSNG